MKVYGCPPLLKIDVSAAMGSIVPPANTTMRACSASLDN